MRWLQLRFDFDLTPFDGRSTAYRRSLRSQRLDVAADPLAMVALTYLLSALMTKYGYPTSCEPRLPILRYYVSFGASAARYLYCLPVRGVVSGATAAGLLQLSTGRHSITPRSALAVSDERGRTARLLGIKVRSHHSAPTLADGLLADRLQAGRSCL